MSGSGKVLTREPASGAPGPSPEPAVERPREPVAPSGGLGEQIADWVTLTKGRIGAFVFFAG